MPVISKHTGPVICTPQERRAAWIQACRLRTLPLAAAGSFVAAAIACAYGCFRWEIAVLMLLCSLALQVVANFADDYGDLSSGLDDDSRVGPRRGMQRGIISVTQMKAALAALCALTLLLGLALVAVAFSAGPAMSGSSLMAALIFVLLGLVCIAAAILYTIGKKPYGYIGLGDFMSFFFFGLVAVVGGSFLYLHAFVPAAWVAGFALGMPVAAVMNINNMRDARADKAKGKRTVANILGDPGMRIYGTALLALGALLFFIAADLLAVRAPWAYLLLVASMIPWIFVCRAFWTIPNPEHFDRLMQPTGMGTVLVALVFTLLVALS